MSETLMAFLLPALGWIAALLLAFHFLASIYSIGPTQVGLVRKRIGSRLPDDNPIAFKGEAGYQSELLMPGLRFKFYLIYAVTKHPWVQVPAGQIGVVISQIGQGLPIGAKSAVFKPEFGNFSDLRNFVEKGGQKGVQRPVLPPGTMASIHPLGFLVITKPRVFGVPVSEEYRKLADEKGRLNFTAFGLVEKQLEVTRIEPTATDKSGRVHDMIGIVTALEGPPLPEGDIANQEVETYKMQRAAQDQRIETEKARGTADMQSELAKSQVGVDIQNNRTAARKKEAEGEATYIEQTGAAQGAQVRAVGLARAEAYQRQVAALGSTATAVVNALEALSKSNQPFVPTTLVTGGNALDGLAATLTRMFADKNSGMRG